ncbi:MAG: GFA family protein [Halioglobus sp.]
MSTTTRSGSCQCRGVTYQIEGDPLMVYACHCSDCQKRTGSAFSMGMIYPLLAISVSGKLSAWTRTSDAGDSNTRQSCQQCGNVIYGEGSATPDIIKLQAGTLDDTSDVFAHAHIWTQSAQPWFELPSGAIQHPTQPENILEIYEAVVKQQAQHESNRPT